VKSEQNSHDEDNPSAGSTIPSQMSWKVLALLVIGFLLLLYGTVAVFEAFDRVSHSNSDTIRPFVITMAPVWALVIWAITVVLRKPQS
jgi:hypothetical protein